jgi:hypothetical protein
MVFKKLSDDMKKGFEKMQDTVKEGMDKMQKDFNNMTEKINPFAKKGDTSAISDTSNEDAAISKASVTEIAESTKSTSPVETKQPNVFQNQWDSFVNSTQSVLKKWQTDWDTINKKNIEKFQKSSGNFQNRLKESNEKTKEFFENQNKAFETKIKSMESEIKEQQSESKSDSKETMDLLQNNWKRFVGGQQNSYDKFVKFQNRLWWKGYMNFCAWMMFVAVIIIVVIKILQYFNIIQSTGTSV